jgi:hypothetical protein
LNRGGRPDNSRLYPLLLLPFKEALEQGLLVFRAQVPVKALFGEKFRKICVLREPILRRFEGLIGFG